MAFKLPSKNFFRRTTGPAVYSRPACWPVITDAAAEVQFLFCDLGDAACQIRTTFTRTSGTQNIVIDWGDGTISTVTTPASTDTSHTYTPGTGTPCPSLGYTTFIIRVYFTGTGVSVLNNCNIMAIPISGNTNSHQICNVLEAYYGDSTQNLTPVNFYSSTGSSSVLSIYSMLQFVKLPATVSWSSWTTTFSECSSLVKVVMPTSNSLAAFYGAAFSNCSQLLEITIPSNSTGILNMGAAFNACSNLRSITLPTSLNSCTSLSSFVFSCYNLRSVTIPSINSAADLSNAFYGCTQLEWVKFTSMPTIPFPNFTSCFNSCSNLQNVYFPATGNASSLHNFQTAFQNCYSLKSIVFPSNINVSSFGSTFFNCYALTSCIMPLSCPGATEYSLTFLSCISLLKITMPAAPTAGVTFLSLFNGCAKLQEVTIPSGYTVTNLGQTFNSCVSLKTISWTPGIQNSCTSIAIAFNNCMLLTNITLPTSMTAITSLSSTFGGCASLTSITLPSTLNNVTTIGSCFANCRSLTSITLPTSMSSCTDFSGTFNNCRSLISVTLPNTVGAVTTFTSTFNNCFSLKTCVLPGAAQLSLVTGISSMFNACSNLVTLTNFDKIGSLTATPLINGNNLTNNRFTSGSAISFSGPFSNLQLNGIASTIKTNVQSVRLLNASAGQWTGSSPQINVSYTNMSTAQIVQLFTDMAAQGNVSSKTINITGATGAAGLTAADRLIITSRGWTITG